MSAPMIEILRNGRGAYAISHFEGLQLKSLRRVPGAIEFIDHDPAKPIRRATISPAIARDFPAVGVVDVFVVGAAARFVGQYEIPIAQ